MQNKMIMEKETMRRSLTRIAHEIIERNHGVEQIVLVGIKTRGIYLAKRIATMLSTFEQQTVEAYALDITAYRDDVKKTMESQTLSISLENKKVILVDDVLFRGRTIRAALDAILSQERAKEIQLAVLIDRGHRELPIRADYVGKNIPTSLSENVKVQVEEIDGCDQVSIYTR